MPNETVVKTEPDEISVTRKQLQQAKSDFGFEPLLDVAEVRLHDTPLYNSIYRFDSEMLVNVHAYGLLAAYTPVFHLRRVDGQWFETYIESYERIWAAARPYGEDEAA